MPSAVENSIRSLALANPALQALIGTRFYPDALPEGAALPAISASIVSDVPNYSHSGTSGWYFARIQYNLHTATYSSLQDVFNALRAALQDLKRTSQSGIYISYVMYLNSLDLELSPEELRLTQYRRAVDFRVAYKASP